MDSVVVILDKRSAPEGEEVDVDSLVSEFHGYGFKRVIVQLASGRSHPDGLQIMRDSILPGSILGIWVK